MGDGAFDDLPLVLALAALTYGLRLVGFGLAGQEVPPVVDRFLRLVPVAAFAALVAPDLVSVPAVGPRLLAAAACAGAVVLTRRLELGLLAGMAAFLALRLVEG